MAYNTAYISQVTLPDGITYDIKDAWARDRLSGLSGAMHFVGTSSTDPTSEGGPTVVKGDEVITNFAAGDVVVYTPSGKAECEYVFNGTSWQEFGSTGSLKALAFKDSASGEVDGSQFTAAPQTFTGKQETLTHSITSATVKASGKYQKANDINTTLTGITAEATGANVTLSYFANFAVVDSEGSVAAGEAPSLESGFYTAGTTGSVPMLTYSGKTASKVSISSGVAAVLDFDAVKSTYVNSFDGGTTANLTYSNFTSKGVKQFDKGTLPSFTQGSKADWSAYVTGETLHFSWTTNGDDTFSKGTLPELQTEQIDASKITYFNGGKVATMTMSDVEGSYIKTWTSNTPTSVSATDVEVSYISNWSAGTMATPATIDTTKFNAGKPTAVTLPTFSKHSGAIGIESITQPDIAVDDITLNYTMTFTEEPINVTGDADIKIADHVFTPEGTNAQSAVSGTASVVVR